MDNLEEKIYSLPQRLASITSDLRISRITYGENNDKFSYVLTFPFETGFGFLAISVKQLEDCIRLTAMNDWSELIDLDSEEHRKKIDKVQKFYGIEYEIDRRDGELNFIKEAKRSNLQLQIITFFIQLIEIVGIFSKF